MNNIQWLGGYANFYVHEHLYEMGRGQLSKEEKPSAPASLLSVDSLIPDEASCQGV